jgi:TonB family protein
MPDFMRLTKQVLLLLLLITSYFYAPAQTDTTKYTYRLESEEKVDISRRQITFRDSLYEIKDYYENDQLARHGFSRERPLYVFYKKQGKYLAYYPNSTLKEEALYKDDSYEGVKRMYFSNGKIYKKLSKEENTEITEEVWSWEGQPLVTGGFGKSKEYSEYHIAVEEGLYKNGLRDSVWTGCYESGDLCYTETYAKGTLVKGTSHDREGQVYAYNEIFQIPEFDGGIPAIYKFLSQHLKYPKKAQRAGISGKVVAKFVIEKDGSVVDVSLVKPVEPSLDGEAIRVIKLTSKHWIPGRNRAIPVRVFFTLPVNFSLE